MIDLICQHSDKRTAWRRNDCRCHLFTTYHRMKSKGMYKGQLYPFLPHTHPSPHRHFSQLYVRIWNQSLQHRADFGSNENKTQKLNCTQKKTDILCRNKEQQNHPGMNYNLSWQQHRGSGPSIKMRWALPIGSGIPDMTDWCQTQLGRQPFSSNALLLNKACICRLMAWNCSETQ